MDLKWSATAANSQKEKQPAITCFLTTHAK